MRIEGQGNDLDLGPMSCTYKDSNQIFSETTVPLSDLDQFYGKVKFGKFGM